MSFNIFDSATKDNIRVGYIDPERGYIATNSIYEANLYASKNPGATFILETRDRVRYLSINEVNRLGPQDITPDQVACQDGIKGLRPGEVPAYPSGNQPLTVGGDTSTPITVGGNGGTPVTSGGNGGRKVIVGGQPVTTGAGNVLKVGGTGGTPVFFGGTGGELVFVGNEILTVKGTEVRVGSTGGIPVKFGGSGGTRITTDGNDELEGKIYISGGGGVGAYAVPIFGTDGSLLSAIVTEGGFGYRNPPQARVIDTGRRGVGAVLKTFVGTATTRTEYYDQEDDFEVYNLTPPGGALPGYGDRFGVDGQNLGEWDPNLFATLAQSPIGLQIRDYQNFLKDVGITPFWHTRKENPLEVIFRDNTKEVKNDVQHWAWGGKTVITTEPGKSQPPAKKPQDGPPAFDELEFEVYTQGGNQADRALEFTFTAEDGSHVFRFKAPDFKDDRKTKVKKKVKRNAKYKVTSSGKYKGKGVEQGLASDFGRKPKEIKGSNKKGTVIFADFVKSSNDNDDLQIRATQGQFTAVRSPEKPDGHSTYELTYVFGSNKDFKPEPKKPEPQKKVTRVIEDSFMNRYAISPVPASDVPGSDFAGRVCTFVWEENFPYSGDYKFRGMADNIGRIFLDNELVLEERKFRGDPTKVVSRYIQEGVHEIKVELFNVPIKIKSKPKTNTPATVPVDFDVYGQGTIANTQISFVFEGGGHSFTIPNVKGPLGGSGSTDKKTINVKPNVDYKVTAIITGDKTHTSKTVSNKREFIIDFDGLNRTNNPIEVSGKNSRNRNNTLKLRDGHGSDTNARFTIMSASPGLDARFSDDGKKLVVKGDSGGDITLRLKWDDKPNTAGVAVKKIKILGETWTQRGEKGSQTKTISLGKPKKEIERSPRALEQGLSKIFGRGKKGTERGEGSGNIIFADYVGSANDNDDMQIRCGNGSFTSSNKSFVKGTGPQGTKRRNTFDLTFRVNAKPVPGNSSDGSQKYESVFNTVDFIGKADRKLWRTNVYGRGGFLNENGVCPFDTKKPLDDNPYAGTHVIRWAGVDFPVDGNYDITVDADDRVKIFIGNREGEGAIGIGNGLIPVDEGGDEVVIENGMDKQSYTRFFKKGKYRIRTELTQIPGGVFAFDKNGRVGGADVTARFVERGGQNYLKVEGTGSAEIHFRLRVDDDPNNSGSFASKLRIGLPPNDFIELKRARTGVGGRGNSRGRLKEKETISGSALFEAGREYLIKTFDSNRDTGSRIKNKGQTLEYDDNISNGFDENADLTITRITNQQKPKIKGINPMALAIDIKVRAAEEERIAPKTWNENPMGAAFTIDAPLPPIPQEPKPQSEGRCPNNPLWTTRFPGGSESWWPVSHRAENGNRTWSKFMNRFAMSPLPPLATVNSDGGGGILYSNSWQVDFPYTGFYGFKGACDDIGRILVDGQEVYKLRGFGKQSPEIEKQKIIEGKHEVTVEVTNRDFRKRKKVKKKILNTKDWVKKEGGAGTPAKVPVKFDVYGQGNKSTKLITYVFTSEDGKDSFTFQPGTSRGGKYSYSKTQNVLPNVNYRVKAATSGRADSGEYEYPIQFEDLNPSNNPIEVSGKNSTNQNDTLKLRDGKGSDANVKFTITSTSPGVSAKFSDDGRKLLTKGKGNVTIRLKYDDNPNYAGEAVRSITIGGVTWRKERKHKGEETRTLSLTKSKTTSLTLEQGCLKRGSFTKGGKGIETSRTSDVIFADIVESSNDNDDMQIRCGTGEFTPSNQRKTPKGRSTYDLTFKVDVDPESGFKTRESFEGITYSGPELFAFKHPAWSDFMNNASISPFLPPLDRENPDIVGVTNYKWSNVKFPENGRYEVKFQADNIAKLLINGIEVQEVRSFRGEPRLRYVELSRGTYDVEVILTNIPTNRNIFNDNPSGFALKITKDITIISSESPPWTRNPVGASAVIIPPPCPKVIEGTGIVERIEVLEPGNGYPRTTGGSGGADGIPVTLKLVDIIPTAPGIGYRPDDRIIVDVPGRPPIELIPTVDDFGQVTRVPIAQIPAIPLPPPETDDRTSGFDIIPNTDAQILQVTDLPGQIGVPDDTGVLIPLVKGDGRIAPGATGTQVPAPGPFYGFTEYPNIYPTSNTGLGFRGRPVFEVVVVPDKVLSDDSVLQVVDIPGIRKTGYVNGKPYYGQVFAKDGFLYAGISQTIGELIPVYATLEASILNRQTIQPSAILRTGSETSDDNPLLK